MRLSKASFLFCVVAMWFAVTAQLCFTAEGQKMNHGLDIAPPFAKEGEKIVSDPTFEAECSRAAKAMADAENWELLAPSLTKNEKFGLVWRADFRFPDGVEEHVNRIMLWRLPGGGLGRFFGSNLDVPPLF